MGPTLLNEILFMVGEQLDKHEDRWNSIFAGLHNWRDMRPFVHVIIEQVRLGTSVRELDLRGWKIYIVSVEEWKDIENDLVLKILVKKSSHSIEEATMAREPRKGHGHAWIALALPLLTHLQNLQLIYATRNHFVNLTMQRAVHGEKSLHKGTAFQYLQGSWPHGPPRDSDNTQPPSAALLMLFFHFQSMRTIDADMLIDSNSVTRHSKKGVGFSPVSEINLRASCGDQGMEDLIFFSKKQHSNSYIHSQGYQPKAFHRSSHSAAEPSRCPIPKRPNPASRQCLPRSIETLYIECYEDRHLAMLVSQLHGALNNYLTCVPKLQRIDIEGPFQNTPADDSGDASSTRIEMINHTIKNKDIQATEPLHMSCIALGG
ncbi:hypothetical protein N7448_009020 [Penicillium atrosanguineum]|nr:hypothetical protein N7448_009020 [Penicillium atrosanguineum]